MLEPSRLVPDAGDAVVPSATNVAYEVSSQLNPAATNELEIEDVLAAVAVADTVAYKLRVFEVPAAIVNPS
jgi:hypothetical protein